MTTVAVPMTTMAVPTTSATSMMYGAYMPTPMPAYSTQMPISTTSAMPISTTSAPMVGSYVPPVTMSGVSSVVGSYVPPVITTAQSALTHASPIVKEVLPATKYNGLARYVEPIRTASVAPRKTYAEPIRTYADRVELKSAYAEPLRTYADRVEPLRSHGGSIRPYTKRVEPLRTYAEPIRTHMEPLTFADELASAYAEPIGLYAEPLRTYAERPWPLSTHAETQRTYAEPLGTYVQPLRTGVESERPISREQLAATGNLVSDESETVIKPYSGGLSKPFKDCEELLRSRPDGAFTESSLRDYTSRNVQPLRPLSTTSVLGRYASPKRSVDYASPSVVPLRSLPTTSGLGRYSSPTTGVSRAHDKVLHEPQHKTYLEPVSTIKTNPIARTPSSISVVAPVATTYTGPARMVDPTMPGYAGSLRVPASFSQTVVGFDNAHRATGGYTGHVTIV